MILYKNIKQPIFQILTMDLHRFKKLLCINLTYPEIFGGIKFKLTIVINNAIFKKKQM